MVLPQGAARRFAFPRSLGNAMTTGPGPELLLIISQDATGGRISVDINSFVEFDLSVTRSLRKLVHAWPHKRPVNAASGRMSSSQKRRPK
jgi:hypothetical protein